ncbi:MAG: LemA family protein [Candidatus Aenigmarchaeota archaeon]|nr:LemA family protein [Candidatus Aenigmarchaeota archaeon]
MELGMILGIGTVVIIAILILIYNSLIRLRNQVDNSWAQIDVQLKRRSNLIPNLVEAVKGYMKHEKSTLENVTKARTSMMNATGVKESADASNMLSDALKSLFAVSENYPDLKASQNFIQLQEEISGTENKIAYARQHYNDMVMVFNTKIQTIPNNIIAGTFNFKEKELFEASEEEKKNVKVSF